MTDNTSGSHRGNATENVVPGEIRGENESEWEDSERDENESDDD